MGFCLKGIGMLERMRQKLTTMKNLCLFFVLCFTCMSCATSRRLEPINYQGSYLVEGSGFLHRVWHSNDSDSESALHVYLHGDGQPWLGPKKIAAVPTSNHQVEFSLWRADSVESFFIGRPCYFDTSDTRCTPLYWTSGRYSIEVRDSLISVLTKIYHDSGKRDIVVIGYSGGGTLAALVANELEFVSELVTIASPLDVHEWTRSHGYSPLSESLSPLDIDIRANLKQLHFIGGKDENVTYKSNDSFYNKNNIEPVIEGDFGHVCCWENLWLDNFLLKENNLEN